MRSGPPRGATASLEVTITPDMTARIADREIHAVYGTVALVAHIEQVCRGLLEPHLEPDEEGVGSRVEVAHHAPVPVGETVSIVATVAVVDPTRLVCEVTVRHNDSIVARGSFEQRTVDRDTFGAQVEERRTASGGHRPVSHGNPDDEAGAGVGGLVGDVATVEFDELTHDGESEPGAGRRP